MLAYDLYKTNKGRTSTFAKTTAPIKKIFFEKNVITVDNVIKDFPKSNQISLEILQEWFSMPLNTLECKKMKLVDVSTQSSQLPPYVRIYCMMEKNKKIITMTTGKKQECTATYHIDDEKVEFNSLADVKIRINKKDYSTDDNQDLFGLYVSSKVLDQDATLCAKTFKQIITKFVEYIKEQAKPNLDRVDRKTVSFYLYVLPTTRDIQKNKKEEKQKNTEFDDAFGNTGTCFSSDTTKTAKFLSADDKAFTINCTGKEKLYENLGIGDKTLAKIELPNENIMRISGFEWIFMDMEDHNNTFKQVKGGLLHQLKQNYNMLHGNYAKQKLASLKVMCIKRDQNKLEVVLDENLTLMKQEEILGKIPDNIPMNALEIMISLSSKKEIWTDYMYVVRAFLAGTKIERRYFIDFFTKQIQKEMPEMLENKNRQVVIYFFKRADFIIKFLSRLPHTQDNTMTDDEEFAYKIGLITRYYIDHKRDTKDQNNSLLGILKYSKYDKASLQNVLVKIGAGIANSKANTTDASKQNDALVKIEKQIQSEMPKNEINEQNNDYSYFFYKGYFTG